MVRREEMGPLEYFQIGSFSLGDYLVFVFTLFTSMMIGVYYAMCGVSNSSDHLAGRKTIGIFPIAMSLTASSISASTLLSIPTDVYLSGTMYCWIIVAVGLSIPVSVCIYLPFYRQLQLSGSIHQYLEMRFSPRIRCLISLLYIFKTIFYLAVMLYAPSLALKRVTGLQEHVSICLMLAVCIFYTAIGGIKAVIWTGTFQLCVMYGSTIILLAKGITLVGGLDNVLMLSGNSSRIELFNIDFDPTARHTVWSLSIGGFFLFTSMYATDQVFIQRCLALPSLRKARISQCINFILLAGIISLCCLTGLVAYAFYFDCAPLKEMKIIKNADEIFLLFAIQTIGKYPGLRGIFAAGIFSGVTSILSSNLHSVSLIILEDLIRPSFPVMRESKASLVTKITVIIFGCITFGAAVFISKFQISLDSFLSFVGAMAGIILGVFSLGMFVPWSNSAGAGLGAIISFAVMMMLGINTHMAISNDLITNDQIKFNIKDNCPPFNSTVVGSSTHFLIKKTDAFVLLRISYLWYTMLSVLIVLILGTTVSLLYEPQDPEKLNPKLLYTVTHCRGLNSSQPSDETERGAVSSRQTNEILMWDLPRRLSPILEVNFPGS